MHRRDVETHVVIASGTLVFLGALAWAAYLLFFGEGASVWSCLQGSGQHCLAGREDMAYSTPVLSVALALVLMWLRERAARDR